jgi:hypothetical protein
MVHIAKAASRTGLRGRAINPVAVTVNVEIAVFLISTRITVVRLITPPAVAPRTTRF